MGCFCLAKWVSFMLWLVKKEKLCWTRNTIVGGLMLQWTSKPNGPMMDHYFSKFQFQF
jgi:hypothetical protein